MKCRLATDKLCVRARSLIAMFTGAATVALSGAVLATAPSPALAAPAATREQVAWIHRAAANFVGDELRGDGAGACSILAARLRGTDGGRTCAERWDARLARLLREPHGRTGLRADARAIPSARVVVHGEFASLQLPAPLISGPNRLQWTENCWMVDG